MKLQSQKIYIIGVAIIMMLSGITILASAETDAQGDIWHYRVSTDGTTWTYEHSTEANDNIDIKEIITSVDGTTLTITLEVYGSIDSSPDTTYTVYFNTSDSTYIFTYNTEGVAVGYSWEYFADPTSIDPLDYLNNVASGTFTADGSILTGTIQLLGSSEATNMWAYAIDGNLAMYQVEWWGDWYPDSYFYSYTGYNPSEEPEDETEDETEDENQDGGTATDDTTGGSDDTPGFELIVFIAALAIALLLIKRKK